MSIKNRPISSPEFSSPRHDIFPSRKHLLDLDDFTAPEIERVLDQSKAMKEILCRDIRKVPVLRGKTIVTAFFEPSTRTRVSFETAGKILSADVINISGAGSSIEKGEALLNTGLTLQAMKADVLVMRHPHSGAPYFLSRKIGTRIINAGDGSHAHPTQSLLDLYTIRDHFSTFSNLKVVIVGDVLYSRVARSNLWGLALMGATVVLCGRPTLIPRDFINDDFKYKKHPFSRINIEHDINIALENADVVMPLRLQKERQHGGHLPTMREYSKLYGINRQRLALAKPGALVMHPGPMNEGVEIDTDVAHGVQSVIEEQVTNGVAVRMAILYGMSTANGEHENKNA